jgi:hypothetical protein
MGEVGDFVYNSFYEPLSDFGSDLLGNDEKIHDKKIAKEHAIDVANQEAQNALNKIDSDRDAARREAARKSELRQKRLREGGRTSTFHSVSPSPLGSSGGGEYFGGY